MLFKLIGKGVNLGKIAAILKWRWFCYKNKLSGIFLPVGLVREIAFKIVLAVKLQTSALLCRKAKIEHPPLGRPTILSSPCGAKTVAANKF
jgi:hypothetical protein